MGNAPEIEGVREVERSLGAWPSFHDSEIVELTLIRGGISRLIVNLDESGKRQIRFELSEVEDLELVEFNHQNVVGSLVIERCGDSVRVILSPCFGVNGWIQASQITVSLVQK